MFIGKTRPKDCMRYLLKKSEILEEDSSIEKCLEIRSVDFMDAIEAGVWIVSLNYITEYVNPSMCRLLGFSCDEMLNHHLLDFIDPESETFVKNDMAKRAKGISNSYSFWMRKKNGTRIEVTVDANPLFDFDKNVIGAMALITRCDNNQQKNLTSSANMPTAKTEKNIKLSFGNLKLHPETLEYSINNERNELSIFAFNLLAYFIKNRGRIVSKSELIENVWENKEVNDQVIDTHIAALRKSLTGFRGSLRTIYGVGFILKMTKYN